MLRLVLNENLVQKGNIAVSRYLCTKAKSTKSKKQPASTTSKVIGLSDKCVKVPSTPVGPGASKNMDYKNPEYFCYHVDSFGEAEVELAKYRLPAPSNKIPFQR
ncbi:NADH:ubiquinone oxidoreductase subunit V3 [Calliopsis andreniformis]|uniref:NADH:ubiquinone oxidoreductase subunit V3 n=1 Tax=Calliopsis andreniformis TaxID=337506 RepID=UPI003FCD9D1F